MLLSASLLLSALLPGIQAYQNAKCASNYDVSLPCSSGLPNWNPGNFIPLCEAGPYTCQAGSAAVFYQWHAMVRSPRETPEFDKYRGKRVVD
jgi:hypothetical protein